MTIPKSNPAQWLRKHFFLLRARYRIWQLHRSCAWMAQHATVREMQQIAARVREEGVKAKYAKEDYEELAAIIEQNAEAVVLRRVFDRDIYRFW